MVTRSPLLTVPGAETGGAPLIEYVAGSPEIEMPAAQVSPVTVIWSEGIGAPRATSGLAGKLKGSGTASHSVVTLKAPDIPPMVRMQVVAVS